MEIGIEGTLTQIQKTVRTETDQMINLDYILCDSIEFGLAQE